MPKYVNENGLARFWDNAKDKLGFASNPINYGADPTGVNDSSAAIAACIAANAGGTIWFSPGIYSVSEPIETPHIGADRVSIDFGGATIVANATMDYLLGIGKLDEQSSGASGIIRTFYRNGTLDTGSANVDVGVLIADYYKDASLVQMNVLGFPCGASIATSGYTESSDANINNCYFYYPDVSFSTGVGLDLYGADNKIADCRIYGFNAGTVVRTRCQWFDNIHFMPKGLTVDYNDPHNTYLAQLSGSCCVEMAGGTATLSRCYCDSLETFVKVTADGITCNIDNCFCYSYLTKAVSRFLDVTAVSNFSGHVSITGSTYYAKLHPDYDDNTGTGTKNETIVLANNNYRIMNSITIDESSTIQNAHRVRTADLFTMGFAENRSCNVFSPATTLPSNTWVPLVTFACPKNGSYNHGAIVYRHAYSNSTPYQVEIQFYHKISDNSVNAELIVQSGSTTNETFGYGVVTGNSDLNYLTLYVKSSASSFYNINDWRYLYSWNCRAVLPHVTADYGYANYDSNAYESDYVNLSNVTAIS